MTFDPAQLQVEGEEQPAPVKIVEPGATGEFGPGPTRLINNVAGDPDLLVPAGQRGAFEEAFARFCRVFPDRFYMEERGRNYFNTSRDRGRYLSAGFHSLMGYFRDDQPLYELMLDGKQQQELDRLWLEMDFVASTTSRMYVQFYANGSRQGGGGLRDDKIAAGTDAKIMDEDVTSETKIKLLEAKYLANAAPGDEVASKAIKNYFSGINATLRSVAKARVAAEPSQLATLLQFAGRAYRRPLSAAENADLLAYYRSCRTKDGLTHEAALREGLVTILMSPDFCYRIDLLAAGKAGQAEYELASRLSYFLWSSMPDEELRAHAQAGDLHEPKVMVAQARRMLKDARSRNLAVEFGTSWLDCRRFEEISTVDRERFPTFTNELRAAMFEEPIRFLQDVLQKDRSVLDLLYAKDTFVNPVLAKHYGATISAQGPDAWVQVEDADRFDRGGILPMAVFLTKNSPGLRTSPVKRGNWVVKNVLGERIRRRPRLCLTCRATKPNSICPCVSYWPVTVRTPIVRPAMTVSTPSVWCLRASAPLASDARKTSRGVRSTRRRSFPAAARAVALRACGNTCGRTVRMILSRMFPRNFWPYALGRTLQLTDRPALQSMRGRLAADQYRIGSLVESVVTSTQFLGRPGHGEISER